MHKGMVELGLSIALLGCSDASPTLLSDLSPDGTLVENVGGTSGDDLWLMGTDDVRHWDGESLIVVPDADNFTPMYQFPVHTTPGALWYVTYEPHRIESLTRDGTRQDHSQHLPAGTTPVALATGGDAVWALLSDGRALDAASGRVLELPGGVRAVAVVDARDVWLMSVGGHHVGRWDGAQLSLHEVELEDSARPWTFVRNDDGETVGLMRSGFRYHSRNNVQVSTRVYLYAHGGVVERREAPAPTVDDLVSPDDSADNEDLDLVSWSDDGELGFLSRRHRFEGGRLTRRIVFTTWNGDALSDEEEVFTFAEDCVAAEEDCQGMDIVRSVRLGDGSVVIVVETSATMRTQQVYVGRFD